MSYTVRTDKGYYSHCITDAQYSLVFTQDQARAHVFDQLESAIHFDDYARRKHGATMTKIEKAE